MFGRSQFALAGLVLSFNLAASSAAVGGDRPKCLFVNSYHQGMTWSDGIARGLEAALGEACELRRFDMDTKRRKSEAEKRERALAAKAEIEAWRPDIVITADDNAAKYLVMPYYRDAQLPIVFCGVNWSAEAYGFPYSNVTGMIEKTPVEATFTTAARLAPGARRAFFLGAQTLSANKNLKRLRAAATARGVELDHAMVETAQDWIAEFRQAQSYDFIIVGHLGGVADWREAEMLPAVNQIAKRPVLTNASDMIKYAMVSLIHVPTEQGQWAGEAALRILAGVSPKDIPLAVNRRQDIWINPALARRAGVHLPASLMRKAKRLEPVASNS